jgi:hypothetical protein
MGSYNGVMDETPLNEIPDAEATSPETDVPSPEQPKAPAQPEVVFEGPASGKEPWRQGSGCGSRLPVYGCIIGVAVMIAVLMAGSAMTRKTVWVNMERGRRAVARALPPNLPPEQRVRTIQNLDRFRAVLEASKDPYPTMGEFMKRVRAAFSDQRLMADEIEELNIFLEKTIEESGIPLLQLGIRNSEFGIRNSHPSTHRYSENGVGGRHSKFKIQNSKFI